MLNHIKSANQNGENWKTKVFWHKKPKYQSKISQNCKTKNPQCPSPDWRIASFCPWQHDTTLLNTAVKVTTWSFGENSQMDLHSSVTQTLFWHFMQHLKFSLKYFNFLTSFFSLTIYYFVRIWLLYFSNSFLFWNMIQSVRFMGKKLSGGLHSTMSTMSCRLNFGLPRKISSFI